ncbi:MAG: hypothetical protein GY765_32975 [bacterium]|nr:hypothetical protein [bacterium]
MSQPEVLICTENGKTLGNCVSTTTGPTPADGTDTGGVEPQMEEDERAKPKNTYTKRIHKFRGVISTSTEDADIQSVMTPNGYPVENFQGALDLAVQTAEAVIKQATEKSRQKKCTRTFHENTDVAWNEYKFLAATGRLAFWDKLGTLDDFGLSGAREKNAAGKLAQMDMFYKVLENADAVAEICKYNVTVERLEAGRNLLLDAREADFDKENAIVDARAATTEKNELYARLRTWMMKYIRTARMVLEDSPKLLEKITRAAPYL